MARESRRKREERRFGRPDRLADRIGLSTPADWIPPRSFEHADAEHRENYWEQIAIAVATVPTLPCFEFSNVCDYMLSHERNPGKFRWESVVIRPPYDHMFLESFPPESAGDVWPRSFPRKFGFIVQHGPADRLIDHWSERISEGVYKVSGAETGMVLIPLWFAPTSGRLSLCFPGCSAHFFLDRNGMPTDRPIISVDRWHRAGGSSDVYKTITDVLVFAAVGSMMFLNCKNVATPIIEPDPAVNRERRRAGLRPFVRHHTICIEPMKQVLKSEGGIEHNGLKKALHICRGHFATYTDRLFGRELETPVTIWRSAHVRGSAKEGIVVSDYRVNSPNKGPTS